MPLVGISKAGRQGGAVSGESQSVSVNKNSSAQSPDVPVTM